MKIMQKKTKKKKRQRHSLKNEKMRERLKQKEAKKQREYIANIESEIIETEDAIKDLEEKMCNPDIYKTGEIVNTQSKYNELKEKLEKLYEEWESLSG